jgi:hypothetical protein
MHGDQGQLTTTQVYANTGRATPLFEIVNLHSAAALGTPNRLGFFGSTKAPNSPVIVGQYQDTSFRTDELGAEFGEMINVKYTGASTADISGTLGAGPFFGSDIALSSIPNVSGTLLARFAEPNDAAVITQQAVLRAINLDANNNVLDVSDLATGITVQAAQLADTDGFAGNSSWSVISSAGAELSLADQSSEATVHDYHLIISGTPAAAGRKINFAYYMQLEFL